MNGIIQNWKIDTTAPPIWVQLHPTERCNLNCLFCQGRHKNTKELKKEKWIRIAEELGKLGVKKVTITGSGEPLIRRDVVLSMSSIVKKYGMEGDIVTNGTLISSKFAERLVKVGWDFMTISLQSPINSVDNFLRGRENAFNLSVEGIKNVIKWKKKLRAEKPILLIAMLLMNKNYNQIERMMQLCTKLNVDGILLRKFTIEEGNTTHLSLNINDEELRKAIKSAKKATENKTISIELEFPIENRETDKDNKNEKGLPYCFSPFMDMTVFPNGLVTSCCAMYPKDDKGGEFVNDISRKSLNEVWQGEIFCRLRKRMFENPPKACKMCTSLTGSLSRFYQKSDEYRINLLKRLGILF